MPRACLASVAGPIRTTHLLLQQKVLAKIADVRDVRRVVHRMYVPDNG
jgi:hypothetical protein